MEFRVVGIKISKIVNIGLKLRLTVQVFGTPCTKTPGLS